MLWLTVPVTLLAVGWKFPLLGFLGFLLLLPVLAILPFLQMQFAARNRFTKMFDVLGVVPLVSASAVGVFLRAVHHAAVRVPLYLLKIELVPRDALMIPALVFIAFIWPARLLTGWVCGRAATALSPSLVLLDHRSAARTVVRSRLRFLCVAVAISFVVRRRQPV